MARRSRKGRVPGAAPAPGEPARRARPPRRSSEERNAEVRAGLEPLAPGERPVWLTVAAIVAGVLGIVTLIVALTDGGDSSPVAILAAPAVLLVAAAGMWMSQYWAVLGFQCLLAIGMVSGFVSLLFASNVQGVVFALAVVAGSTFLFYKLIRAMARLQMPRRP